MLQARVAPARSLNIFGDAPLGPLYLFAENVTYPLRRPPGGGLPGSGGRLRIDLRHPVLSA